MKVKKVSAILIAVCLLAGLPGPGLAGGRKEAPPVAWQKDLESAIRESYLTARPIVLHFCPPGRIALNEDMSTFLEERVKVASVDFVWVRLDPGKFRKLGDRYGVKEIPSLVVVDHTRKKLNTKNVEGHAFAEDILRLMKQVLAKVKVPRAKDVEKLRSIFESAQKSMKGKNLKKAVALLRKIARSRLKIGYVKEAKKALHAIEENARKEIEKAGKLAAEGKNKEADKILRKIEQELRGLEAAAAAREARLKLYSTKEGLKKLRKQENEKQARKLLRLARMYEENEKRQKALEQYEKILEKYPDTEVARKAADRAEELKGHPPTKKDEKKEE